MAIIKELLKKNIVFQINPTFIDLCAQKLKVPATDIYKIVYGLVQRKVLVPGSTLTREEILENAIRTAILKLVQANPGIHIRELCQKIEANNSVVRSHVKVLEAFNYIRKKNYLNPKLSLLFTKDFPEKYDDFFVIWKNETGRQIIQLLLHEKLNISELSLQLNVHHSTIQYHLEKLNSFNMLLKHPDGQSTK
ncbi:MAG: winged helix-turn-helix transcriptional regulator, partial [Candidatus Helarchaeota archaeon]|nr:winged helix-turn-helix transcriptional regulator [Candidatus Helarchaeota archaeon]